MTPSDKKSRKKDFVGESGFMDERVQVRGGFRFRVQV